MQEKKKRQKRVTISEPPASTATTTQSVILLSSVTLSEAERSLLGRGLSFCPTPPRLNAFQLQYDLNIFYRRLRLREYFLDDNSSERHTDHNPFRLRNKRWMPPKNRQPALETYIQAVDDNSKNWSNRKGRDNLTRSERKALHSLRKRITEKDIVIKPADKGSATVVMSFEYYVQEAERQLSNRNHYHPLDCDPTPVFTREVNTLLLQMRERNAIDEATQKYINSSNTRPARFYLLPKVHKPGHPGRPIIYSNNAPTEKISQFVDYHLRPLVEKIPSYIKDTTHFLTKLQEIGTLPPNTLLATLDVSSLYTNIPHEEGISACGEALTSRTLQEPPTHDIIALINYILKKNNFVFGDKHYLQVHGTAMGTRMAPSYANLFMSELEKSLLSRPATAKPSVWWRYIDDIFIIWNHGEEELKKFIEDLNTAHPTINTLHATGQYSGQLMIHALREGPL